MTTTDFLKRKNKILREHLGLTFDLVPESQLTDVPFRWLSIATVADSCPYCQEYLQNEGNNCKGCPMDEAGNNCISKEDSTWKRYANHCTDTFYVNADANSLHCYIESNAYIPMVELINEYNEDGGK